MNQKTLKVLCVLVAVAFLFACGGEKGEVTEQTKQKSPAKEKKMGPRDLGEKIATVYADALVDVTNLLMDKPEPADVVDAVKTMKEEYVQKLFALGQQREAMKEDYKKICDTSIEMEFYTRSKEDWYTTYSELCQHYFDADHDFYNLIVSFNVLGQYANFDLLRKQEPAEAERLGVND